MAISLIIFCWMFLHGAYSWAGAPQGSTGWPEESGRVLGTANASMLKLSLLPQGAKFPAGFHCDAKPESCHFDMAYFLNDGFDPRKKKRLNVLFIPGGPGAINDPDSPNRTLSLWAKKHNIVYFHPRGMARSKIDGDKRYDQFLRVDYVVEDIESLRAKILGSRPWDVIYAHSWGTVVAQRYAFHYGEPKLAETRVKSLVLSGPVDRALVGTRGARVRMIVENLKMIYEYYRSAAGTKNCTCESSEFLRKLLTDFREPQGLLGEARSGKTDNLCFIDPKVIDKITVQLEKIIPDIDANYGSADQIVDNFKTLKQDPRFNNRFGKFDLEFFVALRYLQMTGAPVKNGLAFSVDGRRQISAALVLVQQLATDKPESCKAEGSPFAGAPPLCDSCKRLAEAREEMAPGEDRSSLRGNFVFGVYDGVTRWLPGLMEKSSCFTGNDIAQFIDHGSGEKKFGRDQARKIGIVPGEQICPWDPAKSRHAVPTLLIKGSRDTVVAGCQAEEFFRNGLTDDRRVLFEFPGMGHDLSVARLSDPSRDSSDWADKFTDLLETFIEKADDVAKFRSDPKVKGLVKKFKITDQTVAAKKPCRA
jgi:pimeloyl-ACP methyl ester carboxylesterase